MVNTLSNQSNELSLSIGVTDIDVNLLLMTVASNNSLNRSANSTSFMRETCLFWQCLRARFIRALGCSALGFLIAL